jgi:hypothetical protein
VDPQEPVRTTGISRYLWERKELSPDVGDARERDVWDEREYPTIEDFRAARGRHGIGYRGFCVRIRDDFHVVLDKGQDMEVIPFTYRVG